MRLFNFIIIFFLLAAFTVGIGLKENGGDRILIDNAINNASLVFENLNITNSQNYTAIPNADGFFIVIEKYVKFIGALGLETMRAGIGFGYDKDCQVGVLTTGQLLKLLNIMDSDFDFDFESISSDDEEKFVSMKLVNGKSRINYMLADLAVIPKAKGLKREPNYNITINIDDKFIDLFIKGKNALPDTKSFTLVKNRKTDEYEIVIGYSSTNANSVYIPVEVEKLESDLEKPISFSVDYFKEILSANKGSSNFKLEVSGEGLSHTTVRDEHYVIDYYLAETTTDV